MRRLFRVLWLLVPLALRADFADGVRLYQEHRYAEAQAEFAAIVTDEPDHAAAHHYLGRLGCLRQDFEAGLEHLERAAKLRPDDPEILFDLGATSSLAADRRGFSFRALGLARQGRRAMERAVALAPEVTRYRHALMEFYSRAPRLAGGGLDKAYAQGAAIRARDPLAGTYALANLDLREDRSADALGRWNELLAAEPDQVFALYEFGRIAARSGLHPQRGIAALERCLALPPPADFRRAQALWRLGQLRRRTGDLPGARQAVEAALALEPDNAEIAADLADLNDAS